MGSPFPSMNTITCTNRWVGRKKRERRKQRRSMCGENMGDPWEETQGVHSEGGGRDPAMGLYTPSSAPTPLYRLLWSGRSLCCSRVLWGTTLLMGWRAAVTKRWWLLPRLPKRMSSSKKWSMDYKQVPSLKTEPGAYSWGEGCVPVTQCFLFPCLFIGSHFLSFPSTRSCLAPCPAQESLFPESNVEVVLPPHGQPQQVSTPPPSLARPSYLLTGASGNTSCALVPVHGEDVVVVTCVWGRLLLGFFRCRGERKPVGCGTETMSGHCSGPRAEPTSPHPGWSHQCPGRPVWAGCEYWGGRGGGQWDLRGHVWRISLCRIWQWEDEWLTSGKSICVFLGLGNGMENTVVWEHSWFLHGSPSHPAAAIIQLREKGSAGLYLLLLPTFSCFTPSLP